MDNEMNNVVNFEETTENKKEQVINWIKNHKREIMIGAGVTVLATLGIVVCKNLGSKVNVIPEIPVADLPELPESKVDYDALLEDVYFDTVTDMYNSLIDEAVDNWHFEDTFELENCAKKLVINIEKVINE